MHLTFLTCSISACNPPPLCLDVPHLLDLLYLYFSLQPSTPVFGCTSEAHLLDLLYFSLPPFTSVFGCTSPS
ncbi:hypothetical protein DPMN_186647 [Dreissena polymorpha]|uniref:Uncharacterized protein n=1 Tax=Dreissena polymorpha TaxID=45954 RepID=A0A9D4DMK5_DREPO|nr:hypothetical protein DPMN_186647 [Dreissena polymorpha]